MNDPWGAFDKARSRPDSAPAVPAAQCPMCGENIQHRSASAAELEAAYLADRWGAGSSDRLRAALQEIADTEIRYADGESHESHAKRLRDIARNLLEEMRL